MKFEFPTLNALLKIIIVTLILTVIGYVVFPLVTTDQIPAQRLFAYGIFIGALIGAVVSASRVHFASGTKVESIFVGNLAFKASANALRKLFEDYGDVHDVRLMTDRATRRPRGFGFVEMNRKDARAAIKALNGAEFYGRELKVNIANERKNNN
jgi:hypothetical protein